MTTAIRYRRGARLWSRFKIAPGGTIYAWANHGTEAVGSTDRPRWMVVHWPRGPVYVWQSFGGGGGVVTPPAAAGGRSSYQPILVLGRMMGR